MDGMKFYVCMNDGKTQYLPSAPKSAAALDDGSVIHVGVSTITASRCVRNLGVFIDRRPDIKSKCHKPSVHAHSTSATSIKPAVFCTN